MAHFAQLDNTNKVVAVLVVSNKKILDKNGTEDESLGVAFLQGIFGADTRWKQTSYNARFRDKYASIGDRYDPDEDVFVGPS